MIKIKDENAIFKIKFKNVLFLTGEKHSSNLKVGK